MQSEVPFGVIRRRGSCTRLPSIKIELRLFIISLLKMVFGFSPTPPVERQGCFGPEPPGLIRAITFCRPVSCPPVGSLAQFLQYFEFPVR